MNFTPDQVKWALESHRKCRRRCALIFETNTTTRLLTTCLPMFLRVPRRFHCVCACFDLMTLNTNQLKSQRKLPKSFPFNIAWITLTMAFFTRFTIWLAFKDEKNKVLITTNFMTDRITRLIAISTAVDRNIFGGNLYFIASSINIDQNVGKLSKYIYLREKYIDLTYFGTLFRLGFFPFIFFSIVCYSLKYIPLNVKKISPVVLIAY